MADPLFYGEDTGDGDFHGDMRTWAYVTSAMAGTYYIPFFPRIISSPFRSALFYVYTSSSLSLTFVAIGVCFPSLPSVFVRTSSEAYG